MTAAPRSPSGSSPTVGNVLGFSLLFRDKTALLKLERRALDRGLTLADYEAEIPGISFPLRAPLSTSSYRDRRCKARQLKLQIDHDLVQNHLGKSLVRRTIAGIAVTAVQFEARPDLNAAHRWELVASIEGRTSHGRWARLVAVVEPVPAPTSFAITATRMWLVGSLEVEPETIWDALARALGSRGAAANQPGEPRAIAIPLTSLLVGSFIRAGWKAPDLTDLRLHAVEVDNHHTELAWTASTELLAPPKETASDPIAAALRRARQAVALGQISAAVTRLFSLCDSLDDLHPIQLPALRWVVELTRFSANPGMRSQCIQALWTWLERSPNDARARRILVEQLGRARDFESLIRMTMALAQRTDRVHPQARAALAIASLYGEKLRDPKAALAVLEPLCERTKHEQYPPSLVASMWSTLARIQAHGPAAAIRALDHALDRAATGAQRAALRLSLARTLVEFGHCREALTLETQARADAPDDASVAAFADELAATAIRHELASTTSEPSALERQRWYERLLELDPNDVEALLAVAEQTSATNDRERAAALWRRALELIDDNDPRSVNPALGIAEDELSHGMATQARKRIEQALRLEPASHRAWVLLARVATATGDLELARRGLEGLLHTTEDPPARARIELDLAHTCASLHDAESALAWAKRATEHASQGSAAQAEAARLWVELAARLPDEPDHELAARAALRRAVGAALSPADRRCEALLWNEKRADRKRAIELIRAGLQHAPSDALLLSTLKQLATGEHLDAYLDALENAASQHELGSSRDKILAELAALAAERGDAERCLGALDRMTADTARTPAHLDQRGWAIRSLGREREELRSIDERLKVAPHDVAALARLQHALRDPKAVVHHLLELAAGQPDPVRTMLIDKAVSSSRTTADLELMIVAIRTGLQAGCSEAVRSTWAEAQALALASEASSSGIVELLAVVDSPQGAALREHAERLLDGALAARPTDDPLLERLWIQTAGHDRLDRIASAVARIDRICAEHHLRARTRAELYIGLSDQLDPSHAATMLRERAEAELDDTTLCDQIVAALQERGYVSEALTVLELRVDRGGSAAKKAQDRKRLAELYTEELGDHEAATRQLEAALELTPQDAEAALALLEQRFAQHDLVGAVVLTERMLNDLSFGAAAFSALAHRAADAAITLGDHERAIALLELVRARDPSDRRSKLRLDQLRAQQNKPEHRVALLAAVAGRHSGLARLDALEERARLLQVLGRIDEAIDDLTTVVREAPDRIQTMARLAKLYEGRGQWQELADLLWRKAEREHGEPRCASLRALVSLCQRRLHDHASAEQAIRQALELIDEEQDPDAAEELHHQLVESLRAQDRHLDLALEFERWLAPELEGNVKMEAVRPRRLDLLVELARTYRDDLAEPEKAAKVYECLQALGALPEDGLSTLARAYHQSQRYEELLGVMKARSEQLARTDDVERKAAVDVRIGELLEEQLGRPHEAANYFLDAYLADPNNHHAGQRARVLLCGTDAVANVRKRLIKRLADVPIERRPTLLTMLGDILAPQSEFEKEAETRYREALGLAPGFAPAREALGRLLLRRQDHEGATDALLEVVHNPDVDDKQAAEAAALAAKALVKLGRHAAAERTLESIRERQPESIPVLLELSHVYEQRGRWDALREILDGLLEMPLRRGLVAEVAWRRASMLQSSARERPRGSDADRVLALLERAFEADPQLVPARKALLELAKARADWHLVRRVHHTALSATPPGATQALIFTELAEVHLDHLGEPEAALADLEQALRQAPQDTIVVARCDQLAARHGAPRAIAEHFEKCVIDDPDLDPPVAAQFLLISADAWARTGRIENAQSACRRISELKDVPASLMSAAERRIAGWRDAEIERFDAKKHELLERYEHETSPLQRMETLAALREVGFALRDHGLVEWASRQQLELARDLDGRDTEIDSASEALAQVLLGRGDYEQLIGLFERLANQETDGQRVREALTQAARFAFRGTGDETRAHGLLDRALESDPEDPEALELLAELAVATGDEAIKTRIYERLDALANRSVALDLKLAALARHLGRDEDAIARLQRLAATVADPAVLGSVLTELDNALALASSEADRLPVLRSRVEHAQQAAPDRVPHLALELARLERTLGNAEAGLRACETGLRYVTLQSQVHFDLLRTSIEILGQQAAWVAMARTLAHLGELERSPEAQARTWTQAAEIYVERVASQRSDMAPEKALARARSLLDRAHTVAPDLEQPIGLLIALEFREQRWPQVLAFAERMRQLTADTSPPLVLASLAQTYLHGRKSWARAIGNRHDHATLERYLFPGLEQVLQCVARQGPLSRLDDLLTAATMLCGDPSGMSRSFRQWSKGRPWTSGSALALARLHEAEGNLAHARWMYQVGSWLEPQGPLQELVERWPEPPKRGAFPLFGATGGDRTALRLMLMRLRGYTSGIRLKPAPIVPAPNRWALRAMAAADGWVGRWRTPLKAKLPVQWTAAVLPFGVGIENAREPGILLSREIEGQSAAELQFRLARAAVSIATGMAIVESGACDLASLLEVLTRFANPGHQPTGAKAAALARKFSQRRAWGLRIPPRLRAQLASELAHWASTTEATGKLHARLDRTLVLLATQLSCRLDGTLSALHRTARCPSDRESVLHSDGALWVLRELGLR